MAESLVTKTVVQVADIVRRDDSTPTTTNACASNKKADGCTLPTDSTATIPIVLGVVYAPSKPFIQHRKGLTKFDPEFLSLLR